MPEHEIDLNPVLHITTDAVGPPGKRVFYIQASDKNQVVTVIVEKQQVQSLAISVEEFLKELNERQPDLPEADPEYLEADMQIQKPIDPLFRVGQIGLGYDEQRDLMLLIMREIQSTEDQIEDSSTLRVWCTRAQMRALCHWGLEVSGRGRPICGNCGEPIDPEGHFCPKRNGHKH
jgi:uncharacterized repeat protein (TIGR03847 family)